MNQKNLELNELFNYYCNESNKSDKDIQRIIYFSIGSAANLSTKKTFSVKQRDMHQYPPFIQNIKQLNKNIQIDIFLIDPWLKNKPYIIKFLESQNVSVFINEVYSNIFTTNNGINIYNFKKQVEYEGSKYDDKLMDITNILFKFNEYCISTDNILIFHDFSGRDSWILAEFMDRKIGINNVNKIIYDLSLRDEGSCTLDLMNNELFLPVRMHMYNNKISFLNPFSLTNYQLLEHLKHLKHPTQRVITTNGSVVVNDLFVPLRDCRPQGKSLSTKLSINTNQLFTPINKRIKIFTSHVYPLLRRFISHRKDICNTTNYGAAEDNFLNRVREHEFFFCDKIYNYNIYKLFKKYQTNHTITKIFDLDILDSIINELKSVILEYLIEIYYFPGDDAQELEMYIKSRVQEIDNNMYKWCDEIINEFSLKLQNINENLFLSI